MKLNSDQLASFLQQNGNKPNSPKVFLLTGDEPFQLMEAADAVCAHMHSKQDTVSVKY